MSITLVVIIWVLVTRLLFIIPANSNLNAMAPVLFNGAAILAIYLGINDRRRKALGELKFKEGIRTGLSIALVYAVSSCLFFFVVILFAGQTLMASEPLARTFPMWQVALLAFAGMFFGAVIAGLVYSTIISFLVVRHSRSVSEKSNFSV